MSAIVGFRRRRTFRQWRKIPSRRAFQLVLMLGAIFGFLLPELVAAIDVQNTVFNKPADAPGISCSRPRIIDGDTLDCAGSRIRLASIDAPEMPGHCRDGRECTPGDPFAAKAYLASLTRSGVTCKAEDADSYGRTVARCQSDGRDLSCAMVEAGLAVERYGWLWC